MIKIKAFFNDHWEKLFFGLVFVFSFISLSISLIGLFGSNNEQMYIKSLSNEINGVLAKPTSEKVAINENAVVEFQKAFESREGFEKFNKLIVPTRLFSQEAKQDPTENIKDITRDHSSPSGAPGLNCPKFYVKIKGENVCLVCGAKGDRDYKANPPRLTDLSLIRENIRAGLVANPYVDRQKIRIVWEDDIETDRTIFKDRKASVFRIEITEKNEKTLNEIFEKPTYQKELKDFIKSNQIMPLTKGKDSLELVGDNVGGANFYKAPVKEQADPNKKEENKTPLNDLFKTDSVEKKDAPAPVNVPAPAVGEVKQHKMHDEKVFFNFEDTSFEPLKKYAYILLETFSGESVTRKQLNEWRLSKPVLITTSANNYSFLTRLAPVLDPNLAPVIGKDGKPLYTAEVRIYQYFALQDMFYKKDFRELRIDDEVGAFQRKGEETKPVKTAIMKTKTEPLKGNQLKDDEEWARWKAKYPELKARDAKIEVEQSYTIGAVIKEIGEEKVVIQIPDGKPEIIDYDEKGKPIYKQKFKDVEKVKKYILLEDLLNKTQRKMYESSIREINEELEKSKVKTLEDAKD